MLQNAYFLAKIGADTAENEQHFAVILPKIGNSPTGPPGCPLPLRRQAGVALRERADGGGRHGVGDALGGRAAGAPWHGLRLCFF